LNLNQALLAGQLPPLTFVTAGLELLVAAQAEELPTANPNDYP